MPWDDKQAVLNAASEYAYKWDALKRDGVDEARRHSLLFEDVLALAAAARQAYCEQET